MNKRIMICGASGTGKTTLANHIAELYELPNPNTSAKLVWEKFGFKDHADAHSKSSGSKSLGMDYQTAILTARLDLLKFHKRYVTDRSFVDNAVHIALELGHLLIENEMMAFLDRCSMGMSDCDGLIYLQWTPFIELENDKFRVFNPYFQDMVDKIIHWVIYEEIIRVPCPILKLNMWDFETRIQLVDKWIKKL